MNRRAGFTLIEMVIAAAILIMLFLVTMMSYRVQIDKGRDADRKDDLHKISLAFEEYFSDRECYPPQTILDNCSGSQLQPYLDKIPCDPVTKLPYAYVINGTPLNCPKNYRVLARLDNESDPVIGDLNCAGAQACGWGATLNYGVSSGNVAVSTQAPGSPSPTPGTVYYCQAYGNCTAKPPYLTCTPTYSDPNCGATNLCENTISSCN